MATWFGAVNGTASSKYRVGIDYIWKDNGSGRTYTYNIYLQVTQGNFNGTRIQTNFNGIFSVSGPGVYGRTGNRTANVGYGGTFNPGTYEAYYAGYSSKKYHATVSGSESVPKPTYTVSYNANGGSGAPGNQTKTWGSNLTLSSTKPTRSGYNFLGWGTSSGATSASYQPGGTYSSNSGITLYAIWQVATKITISVPEFSYKVKCDSNYKVTTSSLGETYIPYYPGTVPENVNTNFYYRLYDATKTVVSKVFGPFTGTGIANGTQTTGGATKFLLPAEIMLSSLKNLSSTSEAIFYAEVCTGSTSFASDVTVMQQFRIELENFSYLSKGYETEAYTGPGTGKSYSSIGIRNSSGKAIAGLGLQYPSCYIDQYLNGTVKLTKLTVNGIDRTSSSSASVSVDKTSAHINTHWIDITLGTDIAPTNQSISVLATVTDNISTATLGVRIPPVGGGSITMYENYQNKYPNACTCTEFIEEDRFGFFNGGKIYASEFIEDDGESEIDANGHIMRFGNMIEI